MLALVLLVLVLVSFERGSHSPYVASFHPNRWYADYMTDYYVAIMEFEESDEGKKLRKRYELLESGRDPSGRQEELVLDDHAD